MKAPHGAERNDEYYWLRDDTRKNPEMLGLPQRRERLRRRVHGAAEAAAGQAVRGDRRPHQAGRQLGAVPRARLLVLLALRDRQGLSDLRAPQGQRWTAPEEVLLDVNAMAEGKDYFSVGDWEVSQDNTLLAWAEDAVGRRQYVIRFKNLATGEIFADVITGVSAEPRLGRRQQDAVLRRERPGDAAHRAREEARARHAGDATTCWSTRRRTTASTWASAAPATTSSSASASSSTVSSEPRCTPAADPRRVRRAGAARARRRIRRRPPRRPLGDPHQRDGAKNFKLMTAADGVDLAQATGRTGSRTATTSSSTASNCSTASPRSPSARERPASACAC